MTSLEIAYLFFPRDAMLCVARIMLSSQNVLCPSVCLSVTRRYYCVETAKHIVKGLDTILVFLHQTAWLYSDGDPTNSNGSVECRGI